MIQDFVILAAQGTMLLFLIPTLRSPAHWPKTITSAVTSLSLFAMAISFATLSLWLSAATTAAIGTAWGYMAIGSFFRKR